MSAHDHQTYVAGCHRCDLSRDEVGVSVRDAAVGVVADTVARVRDASPRLPDDADSFDVATAALASLDSPEVVQGIAEVLREHATTLVACAGRIAGFECSCGMASDHGWSEAGARERAQLHVAAAVVAALGGRADG